MKRLPPRFTCVICQFWYIYDDMVCEAVAFVVFWNSVKAIRLHFWAYPAGLCREDALQLLELEAIISHKSSLDDFTPAHPRRRRFPPDVSTTVLQYLQGFTSKKTSQRFYYGCLLWEQPSNSGFQFVQDHLKLVLLILDYMIGKPCWILRSIK